MTVGYIGTTEQPFNVPSGETLTFTHGRGEKAAVVTVCDPATGIALDNVTVTQPDANTVEVANGSGGSLPVVIKLEWITNGQLVVPNDDSRITTG
jgi:CO/xanthine dehydrogenase Mo-binding subunit